MEDTTRRLPLRESAELLKWLSVIAALGLCQTFCWCLFCFHWFYKFVFLVDCTAYSYLVAACCTYCSSFGLHVLNSPDRQLYLLDAWQRTNQNQQPKWMGSVKLIGGVGQIGKTYCWGGFDLQTYCWSGRDWSNLLWERTTLVKFAVGADRIGEMFRKSLLDGSKLLWERVRLVKFTEGVGRIGHIFYRYGTN